MSSNSSEVGRCRAIDRASSHSFSLVTTPSVTDSGALFLCWRSRRLVTIARADARGTRWLRASPRQAPGVRRRSSHRRGFGTVPDSVRDRRAPRHSRTGWTPGCRRHSERALESTDGRSPRAASAVEPVWRTVSGRRPMYRGPVQAGVQYVRKDVVRFVSRPEWEARTMGSGADRWSEMIFGRDDLARAPGSSTLLPTGCSPVIVRAGTGGDDDGHRECRSDHGLGWRGG